MWSMRSTRYLVIPLILGWCYLLSSVLGTDNSTYLYQSGSNLNNSNPSLHRRRRLKVVPQCTMAMPPFDASSTTSLSEDGTTDRVQARSTCLPLLPRSGATVPCERPSKSVSPLPPPTPSSFRRPVSFHRWRHGFHRRCSPGVEQSVNNCHVCTFTLHLYRQCRKTNFFRSFLSPNTSLSVNSPFNSPHFTILLILC